MSNAFTSLGLDIILRPLWCSLTLLYHFFINQILHFKEFLISISSPISDLTGYLSISFWLFAQIPQVIKIYEEKSVAGLSWAFLACWFIGDFLNFMSCLLNKALMFQILLSGYYCIIDTVLVCQFYYYTKMYHNPNSRWYHKRGQIIIITSPKTSLRENLELDKRRASINSNNKGSGPLRAGSFVARVISVGFLSNKVNALPLPLSLINEPYSVPIDPASNTDHPLFYTLINHILEMNTGQIMAWMCTALYLSSRIPQLITNFKLKTTNGVSMKLIWFALTGNLFYSLSLIFNDDSIAGGEISKKFWESQLSYFTGAFGTMIFDLIAILQWFKYDKGGSINLNECEEILVLPQDKNKLVKNHVIINPINFPEGLSASHVRKLTEFTPLSPMDFLTEEQQQTQSDGQHQHHGHHHSYGSFSSRETNFGFSRPSVSMTIINTPPIQMASSLIRNEFTIDGGFKPNEYVFPSK